ncbi:uncharacterized protein LOC142224883 [Haematobia irritans]|uniref:uncharacterized protein LOC142224883 n=1 Tax=Haematobia irritans TaxID=7368 RepID=UPI003F500B85
MSSLLAERSELSRPFTHTGLDFAGPFDMKHYTGRCVRITKGYVCVFICFATKAIHLEATSDLSTNTFLAAFSRFVSRRGCPLHLHSDNGTNLVGASKILARDFLQSSQEAVESNYGHQNITWHFIPPGAPHMGGLWEAGVKSFKSHFHRGMSKFSPIVPGLSRTIRHFGINPGHFLIGSPILAPIDPKIDDSPISLVNLWQRLKIIHQNFCIRWKDEYLKVLHKRHKWKNPTENLKESTLVVVKEENLPPNCWRLRRISKVHPGADDRINIRGNNTPKTQQNKHQSKYACRLCRHIHPLRKCKRFLGMNSVRRQELVKKAPVLPPPDVVIAASNITVCSTFIAGSKNRLNVDIEPTH